MKRFVLYMVISICATTSVMAQDDSLATYIEAAIRNNPAVLSAYQAYQAKVTGACGAGTLNDPELSVGIFPKSMQHVNGKQLATFSVMQMFPWFGTLKAGRQQMEYQAEAAYQKFRADGIALAFDMQKQWYQMLSTQEQIKAVDSKITLLKDIKKVAVYQYKTLSMGKNSRMSDQLRLEAEEARLQEQKASLQDRLQLQRQQFNLTMHRDANSDLFLPDTIVLKAMPVIDWNSIESKDPTIAQLEAQGKAYDAQDLHARGMGKPMIGVGLEFMLNGKVDMPMMANMNGQDMLMPMVKISLPIYRKKINSERRSAQLLKQSTQSGILRQRDVLRSEYLSIGQRAEEVMRKLVLYNKEVEILDHTLQLMQREYVSATTTLTDILSTTREQIDYALKKAEARAQYNTLVAEYEKMISRYDFAERMVVK